MLSYYENCGIEAIHFPIHDFNQEDLKLKIYDGAVLLNQMINEKNLSVYVHCTAGMGRAPAIVVTYLSLFMKMDPDEADLYVKKYRTVSVPNMGVVKVVVAEKLKERKMI